MSAPNDGGPAFPQGIDQGTSAQKSTIPQWAMDAAKEIYPDIAPPLDPHALAIRQRIGRIIAKHAAAIDSARHHTQEGTP